MFVAVWAFSQSNNLANVWFFGNNASLDFNTPTPTAGTGPIDTQEGVATICDQSGNLLFFSDGLTVWDNTNTPMPQGSGLAGHWSSTQAAVIIPNPGNTNQYYIFTMESIDYFSNPGLSYSLVDMTLPGNGSIGSPLGDVVPTEKNIALTSPVVEKLTAVRKCDGTGYWVVAHSIGNNNFITFDVTNGGVNTTPIISSVGINHNITGTANELNAVGQMKFSSDGTKLALVYRDVDNLTTSGAGAYTYDFDNSTGTVSNESHVPGSQNIQSLYGVEFSPDGNQLYIGDLTAVYRADLVLGTPMTLVNSTVPIPGNNVTRSLQIGPDGDLYVSLNNYGFLARIPNPNSNTAVLNTNAVALAAGTNGRFGLPNVVPSLFQPLSNVNLGNDTTYCDNVSQTLDAGGPFASYLWSDGSTNQTLTVNQPGQYWVQVGENGCFAYDTINIGVITTPIINLPNDTTACTLPLTLDAGVIAPNYLWNTGAISQSISVNAAGMYWVVASDGNCFDSVSIQVNVGSLSVDLGPDITECDSTSAVLDAGGPYTSYLWSDGSNSQTLTANQAGQYWVEVDDNGCTGSDTINLIVVPSPTVDLGNDTTLCNGPYVLDAGISPTSYLWSDGSTNQTLTVTSSGTYWVVGSNGVCNDTSTVQVTINNLSVNLGPDMTICNSTTGYLLDPGLSNVTYLWNDGSTGATLLATASQTYFVTVSDGICSAADSVNVQFNTIQASFTQNDVSGCLPLPMDFFDQSTSSSTITDWNWDFGDNNNSTIQNPTNTYNSTGAFNVTLQVTDSEGCTDDTTITVNVAGALAANAGFTYNPQTVSSGSQVFFNNLSENSSSWFWDFGDGSNSTQQNPTHIYQVGGTYQVMLIAMNNEGCDDTLYIFIEVIDEVIFYAPNTFTPNGDERNNEWVYFISNFYDFEIEIYNRWGERIWETTNPNEYWDGTYKGVLVQDGTYTWKVKVTPLDSDDKLQFVGHVNVLW